MKIYQMLRQIVVFALVLSHVGALAQTDKPVPPPDADRPAAESPAETPAAPEPAVEPANVVVEQVSDEQLDAEADAMVDEVLGQAPVQTQIVSSAMIDKFDMFIPTERKDATADERKSAPTPPPVRSQRLDQMSENLEALRREDKLPTWSGKPLVVVVYLQTKEYYETNRDDIATEIMAQVRKVDPTLNPQIRFRVVKTNINHVVMHAFWKRMLRDVEKTGDAADRQEARDIGRINDEVYRQTKSKFEITAPRSDRYRVSGAYVRALTLGAIRAVQFAPVLAAGPIPIAVAAGAIAFDSYIEFYTALKSRNLQLKLANSPVKFKNPTLQWLSNIASSTVANTFLFVTVRSTVMQAAQAFTMPGLMIGPTLASIAIATGVTAPGGVFNALFVDGYNRLVDKGWINVAQVNMGLLGISALDMAVNISNSTASLGWVRFVVLPVIWGSYLGVFGLGRWAPKRADKIVLIHQDINKWDEIKLEQGAAANVDPLVQDLGDRDLEEGLQGIREREAQPKGCEPYFSGTDGEPPAEPRAS